MVKSMEIVKFNSPITLSQHYKILGKVAKKVGKISDKPGDESLVQLISAYNTMEKEAEFLSKFVKKQLSEYNMQILESSAILTDVCGDPFCLFFCGWVLAVGCQVGTGLLCWFSCSAWCAPSLPFLPAYGSCNLACTLICLAITGSLCYFIGYLGGSTDCWGLCCMI
ncbi:hypothetical protein ES703_59393 [subsurface metagenome]